MEEFVQIFGNGFFPCIMCGCLFWYMMQQNEKHDAESKEMQKVISELKESIIQLTDYLKKE